MTNREWLMTLSNEDFANWIYADRTYTYNMNNLQKVVFAPKYSPCLQEVVMPYISYKTRLQQWLEEEREEYDK